ncbi:hypothetical protein [Sphaerisporangium perillae]|uniref:hypothetical protein n=1 Tax=Sphaerisporangium perillae TaxID=2935860 RepID=UPI00200F17A2|nr:hypothetical protein [Sphaerisporangium perillae]
MPAWWLRDFHDDDLDQAIQIWDQSRGGGNPVFSIAEVIAAARAGPNRDEVDLVSLAQSSELYTPADIEFAARKAAQAAFEREVLHGEKRTATTEDYLAAISETRPTLTPEIVAEFQQDIDSYSRV